MATLKELLKEAIDSGACRVLPKDGAITIPYVCPEYGTGMWDSFANHVQAYTPPSDGWITFYAINCGMVVVRQSGYWLKPSQNETDYTEKGFVVPVRKGVLVDLFFNNREGVTSASVQLYFRPCLQK